MSTDNVDRVVIWIVLALIAATLITCTGCADRGVMLTNRCDKGGAAIMVDGVVTACRYTVQVGE